MKPVTAAIVFVILGAFCGALAPVFAKNVVGGASVFTSAALWFSSAAMWAIIYTLVTRKTGKVISEFRKKPLLLVGIGLMDAIGVYLWFAGLSQLGVGTVGFLEKSNTFFALILGVILFRDRFNWGEAMGAAILIIGVLTMSYSPLGLNVWVLGPVGSMLLYAVANSFRKKYVGSVGTTTLVVSRALVVALFLIPAALLTTGMSLPKYPVLLQLAVIPLFSGVLQHILFTASYRHLELSKVWLIASISPFFVMALSYFVHGELLGVAQLLGGLLLLGGTWILILFKARSSGRSSPAA